MANPCPVELRTRVVDAYESGEGSYQTISERFSIGICSVRRWVRRSRMDGELEPRRHGGGTPSIIREQDIDAILDRLGDATANEITAEFNRGRRESQRVHVSSIKRALHRYGYVVKKNAYARSNSYARMSWPSASHS
jgi:transposase